MHVHSECVVLCCMCACVCVCERSKHMARVHSDVWNTEILALSHSHISRYALHGSFHSGSSCEGSVEAS